MERTFRSMQKGKGKTVKKITGCPSSGGDREHYVPNIKDRRDKLLEENSITNEQCKERQDIPPNESQELALARIG